MSRVVREGWMLRYGRRKIGRSYFHRRYFVLEPRVLAYYKKKPDSNMVPVKTIEIDGNCRVEDRGLKTYHGLNVYGIGVYNKEKHQSMNMAAFNIQEALQWKKNIEFVIDQQQSNPSIGKAFDSFEYKAMIENGRTASSSDRDSQGSPDEEEIQRRLGRRTTIGNGLPASMLDWTRELDSGLSFENSGVQVPSRKHWRLIRCQNGLRIFEELLEVDYLPRSCSRAMKAVGAVEATCEEIFQLVMSMDGARYEWDCSFQYGSLVEEVDGHTAILYHRLQLDYFSTFVWPRDLCYVRYWRRNDDGSYVVLFRSQEHGNCGPQPGFVRAHIESGGFKISPLKSRNRRPRTQVQHLMQIDLKGWGLGYFPSFQQHCMLKMLNSVAGLREWFAQSDFPISRPPRIPVMATIPYDSIPSKKDKSMHRSTASMDQMNNASSRLGQLDEDSDDDEDFQISKTDETYMDKLESDFPSNYSFSKELDADIKRIDDVCEKIDLTMFSGNLRRDDRDNSRNCWRLSGGNNFRVRSKQFPYDKSKIPAGKPLMDLVAVDWLKDVRRMDHVSRRRGCAVQVASERGLFSLAINLQVPASMHYSMVFYFVMKELPHGSLLQHFVDGDDEFRNSRLKLIPSVPKGSWIVRQSVGSTPCLLGKAVDCTYIRGPNYLEIDVDIGSSTVANGVLGLVFGVITTLVVDMAFLVQGNTHDELPERLIAAVRLSHIELKTAMDPGFEGSSSSESSQ